MTVTCLLSRPQIDLADNGFLRNLVLAVDKRNVNIYQFWGISDMSKGYFGTNNNDKYLCRNTGAFLCRTSVNMGAETCLERKLDEKNKLGNICINVT